MQIRHCSDGAGQDQPPTKRRKTETGAQSLQYTSPSAALSTKPTASRAVAVPDAALKALASNIREFVSKVAPNSREVEIKQVFIDDVKRSVSLAFGTFPQAKLEVFGSFAMGLSLHNSDIDACVTGIVAPDPHVGYYKEKFEKLEVNHFLSKLETQLWTLGCLRGGNVLRIRNSRIPIAKVKTGSGLEMDISMADNYGSQVVQLMRDKMEQYPALKPLILVLKAWLKSQQLMEVQHGGLGGYSLYNMVIAHLQMEEKLRSKHQSPAKVLGQLLIDFLARFGNSFDCDVDAVSVRDGGIVSRSSINMPASVVDTKICVLCPIKGRDVAGGSFRFADVQSAFSDASYVLERALRDPVMESTSDCPFPYLDQLFDSTAVLRRTGGRTYR